jgi:hypothetical protein
VLKAHQDIRISAGRRLVEQGSQICIGRDTLCLYERRRAPEQRLFIGISPDRSQRR